MEEKTRWEIDADKLDEIVLALLYLNSMTDRSGARAWKSLNWVALDRLHEKGLIGDPKSAARSVQMLDEGMEEGARMAEKHFGKGRD